METALLVAFFFGGIGLLMFLKRHWTFAKLPPGPKGLPLLGNVLQPDPQRPYMLMSQWAEEYGDIYTMWNFNMPMVVCNGFDVIWEMLVTKSTDFAGRTQQYTISHVTLNGKDIVIADYSPEYVRRKKIFMTSIRMYGEGMQRLEDLMVDIIAELLEDTETRKQQPFDPLVPFQLALANVMNLLLFGSKFEQNDPEFLQLLTYLEQNMILLQQSSIRFAYDTFPWLHYLPLAHSKLLTWYMNNFVWQWIPRQIQKVKDNYDSDNCGDSVLEALLKQQQNDMETGVQYPLDDENIIAIVRNFFTGDNTLDSLLENIGTGPNKTMQLILYGINTSTSTLYSMFAIMTAEQDIQAKAREEVDQVLNGRRPTLKDMKSMPYFQAVLEEVFRYVTPGVFAPHKATKDSTLGGHFIPKGTEVVANIWFLLHDANYWEDPHIFKPERFLDKNGEILPNDHPNRKRILTFGAGRRVCPGEALAKNCLFLITTSLLQKFIFKPAADDQLPVYDPLTYKFGLVIMPQPYKVRAIPRY